jgi:group I intron endonuclease
MISILTAEERKQTGIYKITNLIDNKCYIGSTRNSFRVRIKKHRNDLENNKHHSPKLQRAYNKYGADNFEVTILEICSPKICIEREQYYLDLVRPVYNCLLVAGSATGYKHSEETKAKISAAAKIRCQTEEGKANLKPSQKGWKHSDESKAKITAAQLGKTRPHKEDYVCSEEVKAHLLSFSKGRVESEETKAKKSAAMHRYYDKKGLKLLT